MRSYIIATVLVTTTIVAGMPLVQKSGETNGEPIAVSVKNNDLPDREVFANGIVEGRCRDIALRFEPTGRVLSVDVAEGDRVGRGHVLARLDPSTWQHEVAKAEANLALAKAERTRLLNAQRQETCAVFEAEVGVAQIQSAQARKSYLRLKQLIESDAISRQEFEDSETEFLRAEAQLKLAQSKAAEVSAPARADEVQMADARIALEEARVASARTMLAKTELRAPSDGIVLQVRAEPGELVGAQTMEPIVTMVDVSQIRVRAYVEELDAVRICRGMPARISADGLPETTFFGSIISCSPFMIPKKHLSNRPGERVDVKVREVYILLEEQDLLDHLVVGLPVDVFFESYVPVSEDPAI